MPSAGPARGGTAIVENPSGEAGDEQVRSPGSRPSTTATASVDLSGFAELRALLRIRAFRRLWAVLGISSLGDWLGLLATSTFAANQVNSSAAKGLAFGSVIAVRLLPALVLGPLAGVFADRFDRRYTMVACDVVRFLLFASIPTVGLLTPNAAVVVGWAAVATFIIESAGMAWAPAKDASVPNLLPRARLEIANQLTLATTYGLTPVLAALSLAGLTRTVEEFNPAAHSWANPTNIALWFNALTFLATALVVLFGISEISGRTANRTREHKPGLLREFVQGWAYVGKTPLVRGLVLGILGAFAGAGVVVGTAQFYARSLGGGDSTFYILFAVLFAGLAGGIVGGPRLVGALSRRRWFGLSIVLGAVCVGLLAIAPHLALAVIAATGVGMGAGMAFLAGTTLLGTEVGDEVRGRVFAFIQTGTRVVLMLAISLSGVLVGLGGSRLLFKVAGLGVALSSTRLLLLAAGVFGVLAGLGALRQMDDKTGVPILADLFSSLRGRPLSVTERSTGVGLFVVFEGGEGAGKSTQVNLLAEAVRGLGREVVITREPGATDVGARIRKLLLEGPPAGTAPMTPRAEALLYAADRAHHVASVVRPALDRSAVVISDRYVDSSLAYQGAGRTLPVDEISWLSAWATGGLKPDLVVLLDVDPAVGLRRVNSRGHTADRLENESLAFHERVRYAFLDLAADEPSRYQVLDATLPPDELAALVAKRVAKMLPRLAEPTGPTGPAEPNGLAEPVEPAGPVEPNGLAELAEPAGPVEPNGLAEPDGPVVPTGPTATPEGASLDGGAPSSPPDGKRRLRSGAVGDGAVGDGAVGDGAVEDGAVEDQVDGHVEAKA
jgi:dTMP kinase